MSIVLLITVCTAAVSQRLRINEVDSMDVEMHLGHGIRFGSHLQTVPSVI